MTAAQSECPACGRNGYWTGLTSENRGRLTFEVACGSCTNVFDEYDVELEKRLASDPAHELPEVDRLSTALSWQARARGKSLAWIWSFDLRDDPRVGLVERGERNKLLGLYRTTSSIVENLAAVSRLSGEGWAIEPGRADFRIDATNCVYGTGGPLFGLTSGRVVVERLCGGRLLSIDPVARIIMGKKGPPIAFDAVTEVRHQGTLKFTVSVRVKNVWRSLLTQSNYFVIIDPAYDAYELEQDSAFSKLIGQTLARLVGCPFESVE